MSPRAPFPSLIGLGDWSVGVLPNNYTADVDGPAIDLGTTDRTLLVVYNTGLMNGDTFFQPFCSWASSGAGPWSLITESQVADMTLPGTAASAQFVCPGRFLQVSTAVRGEDSDGHFNAVVTPLG